MNMKSRFLPCSLVLAGLVMPNCLTAQPLQLVADLPSRSGNGEFFGSPTALAAVNGKVLVYLEGSARLLWATDGTAAATTVIAEVWKYSSTRLAVVAVAPRHVFLMSEANASGFWRSDGTRAGTFALASSRGDVLLPMDTEVPSAVGAGDGLFARACSADPLCGIWYNSGAVATSSFVAPLDAVGDGRQMVVLGDTLYYNRGSELVAVGAQERQVRLVFASTGGGIGNLALAGGRLYFTARRNSGTEAWSSDGTERGTRPLTSFANPKPFGAPQFLLAGDRVYFVADDGVFGQEVWSTSMAATGLRRETDFRIAHPFGFNSDFGFLLPPLRLSQRLVFAASDGVRGPTLWVTGAGGSVAELLPPCGAGCTPLYASAGLVGIGGRAVFMARDSDQILEPWSSDGTVVGTQALVDLSFADGFPAETGDRIMDVGGRVGFWAGGNLWLSDGTPAGTTVLFRSIGLSDFGGPVVRSGGKYFFTGRDALYRREVWVSDGGPEAGTVITNLVSEVVSSSPAGLMGLGGRALFAAADLSLFGRGAFGTDGTEAGTTHLPSLQFTDCGPRGCERIPLVHAGLAYFNGRTDVFFGSRELWRSDGTVAGTVQLTNAADETAWFSAAAMGAEAFVLSSRGNTFELWSSNGTPAGTRVRLSLPDFEAVWGLTSIGSELYFAGRKGSVTNVWRTDGTIVGTHQVSHFEPGGTNVSAFPSFVAAADRVYFTATGEEGEELWLTDGSSASTMLVARPQERRSLIAFQGAVYFFARVSATSRGLFRTAPGESGVSVVAEFEARPIDASYSPGEMRVWGNHLYFLATRSPFGRELWRSDGTALGTALVKDVFPGTTDSAISFLTVAPTSLFFSADDGIHGSELWRSDGTAAGTLLVEDLEPGPEGSAPSEAVVANGRLLFPATEYRYGRELWSLDLGAERQCSSSSTALCLNGGKFRVTADWRDFQGNTGTGRAVPLSADTGYFWFFDPANVEVMAKVLDGRGLNDHYWTFYSALSNVEYTLTVTEVSTGATRRYFNPRGQFASVGDTQSLGPLGAFSRTPPRRAAPLGLTAPAVSAGTCAPSATVLCLNQGRFAVQATWRDFQNRTGVGTAVALTSDTGYFWFFSDSNVEVVTKVLDGRGLNNKFWVFYGALSNVEYTLSVTDTVTGSVRTYRNPLGTFGSVGDTNAF